MTPTAEPTTGAWVVLVSQKGFYLGHSVHESKAAAEEWRKCKEHDGEDTNLAYLNHDAIETIATIHAKRSH